jgi:PEP-CTERM motif
VTSNIHHLGRQQRGAKGKTVRSRVALALAVVAAHFAPATEADASAREMNSAWTYGFADSLWTKKEIEPSGTRSSSVGDGTLRCFASCGPAFGVDVVRRNELLNTPDASGKTILDTSGHPVGVSGMIVTERLEPDAFGGTWVVVGEGMLDSSGTHSWFLLSADVSLDSPWRSTNLYTFEGSSFAMDFAGGPPLATTPEPSTWAMMLIGFAGLGMAGYRCAKTSVRPTPFLKRTTSQ